MADSDESTPLLLSSTAGETHNYKRFGIAASVMLSGVALLLTSNNNAPSSTVNKAKQQSIKQSSSFPDNFIWGAATSAYQIEGGSSAGGRGPSIWDVWCKQSPNNCNSENANVTDDHFHHWQEDIELMHNMGLKAYRFSISWSRILPTGKAEGTESGDHRYSMTKGINYEGVEFYNRIIDALIAKGIEPFVTFYHWDLPQDLQDEYGGWESTQVIEDFAKYARICFQFFGDRVKYFITINEAWSVAIGGYEGGQKAPGIVSEEQGGTGKPYLIAHHLLLAHARAVNIFREEGYENWYFHGGSNTTGKIGISHSGDYRFPVSRNSTADRKAATRAMEFQIGWLTDPLWFGTYPKSMQQILGKRLPTFTKQEIKLLKGSADFIGLNHYSSMMAAFPTVPPNYSGYWSDQYVTLSDDPSWSKTDMGWNIVPDGAREMLLWLDKRYKHPLIFVTENGMAAYEPDLEHSLQDTSRRDYLEGYIRGFGQALSQDVNLGGYFAWSLMDNFEWEYGFSKRFGLVHVNYTTLVRTPKLSADWYRSTIESNGANISMD
ncbi:hypothetical protein ACHAWO_010482 [Cyclotella atomus]|uniref:beta-glucosidase n=1 Tax=Cyclotella atomus TaxID=382360 RepID=A0ABD3Q804_9STRA